jgi:hypothetical protein
MKKIIKLDESDLLKIINRVIFEQTTKLTIPKEYYKMQPLDNYQYQNRQPQVIYGQKFPCIPKQVLSFVSFIDKHSQDLQKELKIDLNTLILLTKASVGILGRETTFGTYTEKTDTYVEKARAIGLGRGVDYVLKKHYDDKQQSLGMAQITKDYWTRNNLDKILGSYDTSFDTTQQGLAVLYGLKNRYDLALQKGLKKEPSNNQILQKYGIITSVDGTGNNALDLAIVGHNFGEGIINKYVQTSHPLYATTIGQTTSSPFETEESFNTWASRSKLMRSKNVPDNLKQFPGKLQVTNNILPNYFPNKAASVNTFSHTSIGYLEGVVDYMNKFGCLDLIGSNNVKYTY